MLDKLELLTARPSPDQAALTDLRVKLVRATRERLDLLQTRVLPDLEKAASPKIANMIARLRAKIDAIRGASAQQIGTWSLDKILSDWSGYCAASEKMRSRIRSQITAEQEVIYLARRYMGRRSGEKD